MVQALFGFGLIGTAGGGKLGRGELASGCWGEVQPAAHKPDRDHPLGTDPHKENRPEKLCAAARRHRPAHHHCQHGSLVLPVAIAAQAPSLVVDRPREAPFGALGELER